MTLIKCACGCGNFREECDPQGRKRRFIGNHGKRLRDKRECFACGSDHSRNWTLNKPTPYFLCTNCRHLLTRDYDREYSMNRITFKDKRIYVKNARTGVCSSCGEKRFTNIHHTEYDDKDPLANIIELCVPCHTREGLRLGHLVPIRQAMAVFEVK